MDKILVVNNDLETMDLLKSWLESKTYDVEITSSRAKVLQLIHDFKPNVVVADIAQNLVVHDLRGNKNTRDIPILLMSGYTKEQDVLKLDVDDTIEKPFDFPLFEYKLQKLIKKAS